MLGHEKLGVQKMFLFLVVESNPASNNQTAEGLMCWYFACASGCPIGLGAIRTELRILKSWLLESIAGMKEQRRKRERAAAKRHANKYKQLAARGK